MAAATSFALALAITPARAEPTPDPDSPTPTVTTQPPTATTQPPAETEQPTTPPTTPLPTTPPATPPAGTPAPPDPPQPPRPPNTDEEPPAPPADPNEAYEQALQGAQTVAVAEAQRLLSQVMGDLDTARASFAEASAAADDARATDVQARQQLAIAAEAVARTQRQIDELSARTESTRNSLGALARQAYQGNNLSALGVVLAAETPDELASRYMGMRAMLRTGSAALEQMAVDQAELSNAHARLEAQRRQRERSADAASESLAAREAAEQAALAAQQVLDDTTTLVNAALQAAEQAKLEDYQRHMEMLQQSTAVGEMLTAVDYGPGYGTGTFVRPATGPTTSEYGQRLHPILGYVKMHTGLDFGRGDGRIYAADAGTVVEARWNNAYGNMVIVDHGMVNGQRLTTMYAHQTDLMVQPGQRVEKGQYIGNIGSTGYSTGPHLHFEVRLDGQHTDPWPWVSNAPLPGS
ncbi:M23 family metallopeptidase [Jiangella gansuensis]|uniref:M23 family metallopeptidase n=1 Tax=Jiangella gansuensis TaxID=281473 RepID=UPI0004B263B9|nr:M23 family metallopeptidase [Jiangella gansuensis]